MMKKIAALLLVLLTATLTLHAQEEQSIRTGVLPSGLTYYIHETSDFGPELNAYLLQNVGAIVEEDDEQGMAHFLEHIAFNTTHHYPSGVMNFLRTNNITFNALTGVSETKYYLYSIPTGDEAKVRDALQLIHDWCGGVEITKASVEKEKGIVTEEWRQRHSLSKRIQDAIAPVIYNHSPYAYRNVIGTPEGIRSITPKRLKAFYEKWYRPDLQCLVLISDLPAERMEAMVKEKFADLTMPSKAPVRQDPVIADHDRVLYEAFEDAESPGYSFGIYQRIPVSTDPKSRHSIKESLLSRIYNTLLAQRIGMIRNDGSEEYIAAVATYSPLVRGYDQSAWDVVPYAGRETEALHQILALRESIRREGFSEEEFETAQETIYKDLQSLLSAEKLGTPDNIMEVFRQNYLYGQPITSFRRQLTTTAETLVELSAEDLNEWVRSWMDERNLSFITYTTPDQPSPLGLEDFTRMLAAVKEEPTLRFAAPAPISRLIPEGALQPGKIVSEKEIPELGAQEWRLSNGSRMLYMPMKELKGEIFFAGTALGGHSIIAPEDIPSYDMMQSLLLQSGVGDYSRNSLAQWLAGKSFDLSINITESTDGIGGTAASQALPEMMAYTHMILGEHRFSEEVYDRQLQRQRYLQLSRSRTGMDAVSDSIQRLLYPTSPLNPLKDAAYYDAISLERVRRLFDEKFGNLAHFTFCIAGDVDEATARQLTEQYIASLPGEPGTTPRSYRERDLSSPERHINASFSAEIPGDIGQVEQSYILDEELSTREQKALKILEGILRYRLFDELRERESLTYGIAVRTDYSAYPSPSTSLNVRIETSRESVPVVRERLDRILTDISEGRFREEDHKRAMMPLAMEEKMTRSSGETAEEAEHPLLRLALLNAYIETGKLPSAETKAESEVRYDEITSEEVSSLLSRMLTSGKSRIIVVQSTPPDPTQLHK